MELSITTPALLFPAIAILTLGYVNRYLGVASVIRAFKKDYDSGYVHNDIKAQLVILRKRVELVRHMISVAIGSLMLACLSMLFIFIELDIAGVVAFGISVIGMTLSMVISLLETRLSNKSLLIELDEILHHEKNIS
jgi:hypothetical protein